MNKNEIIVVIANKLNNTVGKKDIGSVINSFIDTVKETLVNDERITLEGFISLDTLIVDEKSGTCFGQYWSTPKKHTPTISYSKSFKKLIASKKI